MRSKGQAKARVAKKIKTVKAGNLENQRTGSDGIQSPDGQHHLLLCLNIIIGFIEEPFAAVSMHGGNGTSKLICATHGAKKLLTPSDDGEQTDGAHTQVFLDHCRKLRDGQKDFVHWASPKGSTYRLVRKQSDGCPIELLLIHFRPERNMISAELDVETMASEKGLTPCEIKVFVRMARGLGNKEIGRDLKTSVHTVRAHLRNIFKTLNVSSRVEALNAVRKLRDGSI